MFKIYFLILEIFSNDRQTTRNFDLRAHNIILLKLYPKLVIRIELFGIFSFQVSPETCH